MPIPGTDEPIPGPDPQRGTPRAITDDDLAVHKARLIAELAPGIAHDLVNQVGGISQFLPLVLGDLEARDARMLLESATRAVDTVQSFQRFVRTSPTGVQAERLDRLVASVRTLAAHELQSVAVTVDLPPDPPAVEGVPEELRHAVIAVLLDRLAGMGTPPAGAIRLAMLAPAPGASVVELTIEDALGEPGPDEPGPEVARHLLQRGGGSLRHEAMPDGGTRFVLGMRRAAEAAPDSPSPTASGSAATPAQPQPTTVLVCDDDPSVRSMIGRMLRRDGVTCLEAATGEAALEALAATTVDVVLADHRLEGMTGADLYLLAVERDPRLTGRFVLMSGDAGDAALVAFTRQHGLRVLAKPFTVKIADVVREVAREDQRG